jgi:hypothetical protein
MRMRKPVKRDKSGQLLIVAALAIAVLISSTTVYVYNLSKEDSNTDAPSISDLILALTQSTKNAVISSLANVSNGGAKSSLSTNLDELSKTFRSIRNSGTCNLASTVYNDSGYSFGTRLSWNDSGIGASSAFANFTLQVYGLASKATTKYSANVTTTLAVNGSYTISGGTEKNVSLTCKVYNEAQQALARNLTVFYYDGGSWTQVNASNNLSIVDYGDGTYLVSFTVSATDPVQTSVHLTDLRNIFVRANATCSAI